MRITAWLLWPVCYVLGAAIFLLGEVAAFSSPSPAYGIDQAILREQLRRSSSGHPVDYLFTGDSSGLVGIDAPKLSELLHAGVEVLSTMGSVGPAGWAALAQRYGESGGEIDTVVLLIHPGPLANVAVDGPCAPCIRPDYEHAAVTTEWPPVRFGTNLTRAAKWALGMYLSLPFPAPWGSTWLSARDIRSWLDEDHGTFVDPIYGAWCQSPEFKVTISEDVASRLEPMARALRRSRARRILIGMTPIPDKCVGPETRATHDAVLARVAAAIPEAALLDLPMSLPDPNFAGFTHLNLYGRGPYTEIVARALAQAAQEARGAAAPASNQPTR